MTSAWQANKSQFPHKFFEGFYVRLQIADFDAILVTLFDEMGGRVSMKVLYWMIG